MARFYPATDCASRYR